MKTVTGKTGSLAVAGALVLISQGALSDEARAASAHEVQTVTAERPQLRFDASITTDATASIRAVDRRIAEDLEKSLEAIAPSRIELVISEVPTRG